MKKRIIEVAFKKRVIPAIIGLMFLTMFSTTSAMATVKFEVDNDSGRNSIYGTWEKLTVGNKGDSRMHRGNGTSEYYWIVNPGSYNSSLNMEVYLNNVLFNNSQASYYAAAGFIVDIDQQYANTWTRLYPPVKFIANTDNYFSVRVAKSLSTRNTGADTVRFTY